MEISAKFLALGLTAALIAAAPALAAESAAVTSPRMTATLVSSSDQVPSGGEVRLALRLRTAPGWHTYWRNPGDAGVAPELDFTLPPGVTAGPIAWPAPQRMPEGQVMTYGYTGEVLLPVRVTAPAGGLAVKLHATWLVCAKICVPEQGDFTLTLPAGPITPSPQSALFTAADARMPRPSPWQALIAPDGVLSVTGPEISPATIKDAWLFPDDPGAILADGPQHLSVHDGGFTLALPPDPDWKPATGLHGVLTVRDGAVIRSAVSWPAPPGPAVAASSLWQMLGFAFLGGLILNLMPCVFPVLAIKAAGLARLSGAARGAARGHALSYAAGVVVTFVALAAVLLAVRAGGGAAGWGFQFQSPVFVAAMAWLLFAVGLNLSGVFAVGGRIEGAGQTLTAQGGHVGSFFTGLLAVLVATPCTAPFMGAAIVAALAAPAPEMVAIFAVMGAGLAAPYLLLADIPALARALPRPGAWMDVLKQALAFPMYAASAWLVWVASQQSGPTGVLAVAAGLVLVGFAGWAVGLAQQGGRGRLVARGAASLAGIAAVAILVATSLMPAAAPQTNVREAGAESFSPARLDALRAAGKPVFVNMTAAWCVTCLVNERVTLGSNAVRDAFAASNVTYLKGDWTREDPAISAFLHSQGRDGVPLYVFYPPDHGAPEILPQILTQQMVLSRLSGMAS
jgi:thiol:disulfide interchange protein/DsbC/DsbD-like thiol-disulfide interchange protein